MAESLISKRAVFEVGLQKAFLLSCKNKLRVSWKDIAQKLSLSDKTLQGWCSEKFNMSYTSLGLLCEMTDSKLPTDIKVVSWKEHLSKIAHSGGAAVVKKYGRVMVDEVKRKKKWKDWWENKGQFENRLHSHRLPITIPKRDTVLAEFVGIMMGDGGVAPYHISITLNAETDIDYTKYVTELIEKLFNVKSKVYKRKNMKALAIIVHRKDLVSFCNSIGLPKGNKLKNGLAIPSWITKDHEKIRACIRGLFDTDGSMFFHTYISKDKHYSYFKISLSSRSPKLLKNVKNSLINSGINVRISKDQNEVRIENQKSVGIYIDLIGTSNPKHQEKIDIWRSAGAV